MSARDIAQSLNGVACASGWSCNCPVLGHGKGKGDRNRSLLVRDGNKPGRVLVKCFAGCGAKDIIEELRRLGLLDNDSPATTTKTDRKDYTEFALTIWRNAVSAEGTLVETYLRSRSITLPPPLTLRFASALPHKPTGTFWPAMIGLVTCGPAILGIHRTFLARDGSGKAGVDPNKMMLGPCGGGAVKLGPETDKIYVSEGIENALSVMQALGGTAWAALSQVGMRALELPAAVRDVIICADSDPVGERAAMEAGQRWAAEGRLVRIARPPPDKDFNDLLREEVGA